MHWLERKCIEREQPKCKRRKPVNSLCDLSKSSTARICNNNSVGKCDIFFVRRLVCSSWLLLRLCAYENAIFEWHPSNITIYNVKYNKTI